MTGYPTTRRAFLQTTAATTLAATIPATLVRATPALKSAPKATADSCIFLMLTGGPSQLDTWDPKPHAPSDIRSPFRPIATRTPGVHFTELFPKMASMSDQFSLIRTMHHDHAPIHETGFQLVNTGKLFGDGPEQPHIGAICASLKSATSASSRFAVWPNREVDTGMSVSHGQGHAWLGSPETDSALQSEAANWSFGMACQQAALRCSTSSDFLTLNQFNTVFDTPSWDCHADGGSLCTDLGDYKNSVAPSFDDAFTGLLKTLKAQGRLERTLVVAIGEFGRTPKFNSNGGRDHWPGCWTAIVAGGGVQGGRVVGQSDATASEPIDRPVRPQDLAATIFTALGIAPETKLAGPAGSSVVASDGLPIRELF